MKTSASTVTSFNFSLRIAFTEFDYELMIDKKQLNESLNQFNRNRSVKEKLRRKPSFKLVENKIRGRMKQQLL